MLWIHQLILLRPRREHITLFWDHLVACQYIGIPAGTLGWLYLPTPPPRSPPPVGLPGKAPLLTWPSLTLGGQGVWTPGSHLRPTRHASWPRSASREKIKIKITTKTTQPKLAQTYNNTTKKKKKKKMKRGLVCIAEDDWRWAIHATWSLVWEHKVPTFCAHAQRTLATPTDLLHPASSTALRWLVNLV